MSQSKAQSKAQKKNKVILYRLFKMVSVGVVDDPINQAYDVIIRIFKKSRSIHAKL